MLFQSLCAEKTNKIPIIDSHSTARYPFIYKDHTTICGYVSSCTIELNKLFLHEILISTQHEKLISVRYEKLITVHRRKLITTHDCGGVNKDA